MLFAIFAPIIMIASSSESAMRSDINRSIAVICSNDAACIAEQRQALKNYLGYSVIFNAPRSTMEACMRSATNSEKITNWVTARSCMKKWSEARKSAVPRP